MWKKKILILKNPVYAFCFGSLPHLISDATPTNYEKEFRFTDFFSSYINLIYIYLYQTSITCMLWNSIFFTQQKINKRKFYRRLFLLQIKDLVKRGGCPFYYDFASPEVTSIFKINRTHISSTCFTRIKTQKRPRNLIIFKFVKIEAKQI